jgi:ABC-type branched-subunit amino acid transport system substrate-binding protein
VKALEVEAARVGLSIADEQRFDGSVTDFHSLIARAARAHPDVYYVEALQPGLDLLGQQLSDAGIHNISAVVALSLSNKPELFEGAWYTDSNLREIGFKQRFEQKYPDTRFATHMMPYAYDSVNMIVQAFERGQNPAVYLRDLRTYMKMPAFFPGASDQVLQAVAELRQDSTLRGFVLDLAPRSDRDGPRKARLAF